MASELTRKTISMDSQLYAEALERAELMGYSSFSEYLQFLMESDVSERPTHVTTRNDQGTTTQKTPAIDPKLTDPVMVGETDESENPPDDGAPPSKKEPVKY